MILHVRVLPVAKPKSRRAKRRAQNEENFVKKQKRLGTRPIRPRQARSKVGTARPVLNTNQKNHVFCKKTRFVQNAKIVQDTWAPASQGRSLVATFYATSPGDLLLLQVTHIRLFLSCLGDLCSGGTPGRVFLHFFRKVLGPACVSISYVISLRSGFVATSKKCVQKFLYKYVRWGLLTDPPV